MKTSSIEQVLRDYEAVLNYLFVADFELPEWLKMSRQRRLAMQTIEKGYMELYSLNGSDSILEYMADTWSSQKPTIDKLSPLMIEDGWTQQKNGKWIPPKTEEG